MERFLSQCAKYIFKKHSYELQNICIVFPNRRAGVFFTSYLQKQLSGTVLGPEITTINELISGFSEFHQGEKLQLISILYEIFRKYTQTKESFDEFYFWGEILLSDFNDVDRYLVDAKDLFRNLNDLKEIESLFDYLTPDQKKALEQFWGSLGASGEKENHKKFAAIWEKLYPVYVEFKKYLQEKELGYGGMIYRSVVEDLNKREYDFKFKKYYIVGLNALNSCEKVFLNHLKKEQKAEFLWDFDLFYMEDIKNEAGTFLRENVKLFPPPEDFELDVNSFDNNKNVKLVAVSSSFGQAQEIPNFLEETRRNFKTEFDNTAIVLADESLLFPVLGAIPENKGTVNVTMGYPVKNSVVYGFLLLLINLLKNRKINTNNELVVYHRFVTDILNHQLLGNTEPQKTKLFLSDLKIKNQILVPLKSIDFSPLHQLIFSLPEKTEYYSDYFLNILGEFYQSLNVSDSENKMLLELIYTIYQSVEKLKAVINNVQQEQNREISDTVYFRLFNQYLSQVSVAFEGEPLSGMQVMGILETRCLDFENLIILGLNENKWPRAFTAPSFIPHNIRKGFGLPGIDEQDAMYGYYFYRLFQRAKNVTATYSTLKDGINTGELSRYGYQLQYDSNQNPKISNLDFAFANDPVNPILVQSSIKKTEFLLQRNLTGHPLSPSAINTFLQCRLRFYFRYIVQLPEPGEVKDEIDSPVFGNIFHETIEALYQPFVGKVINKKDLEDLRKNNILIENEIRKAIAKHYFKVKSPKVKTVKLEGKTLLIFENIKTFLNRLIELDISYTPFTLISLEENYQTSLMVNINGNQENIVLGGKIDRVDKVNGKLRVLDYKTGNVDKFSFKTIEELFEKDREKPLKEILQALLYTFILSKNVKGETDFQPVIYSLRKFFDENHSPEITPYKRDFSFQEIESEFEENLIMLVEEIFLPANTFYQTPHDKVCQYCPYRKICQRF